MAKLGTKKPRSRKTVKIQNVGSKMETCDMYSQLRRMIRHCRWLGMCPIEGLHSPDISGLKYNLRSLYLIYYLLTVVGHIVITSLTFVGVVVLDKSLAMLSHLFFYGAALVSVVNVHRVAKRWPTLIKEIAKIEDLIIVKLNKNISRQNVAMCLVITLLGGVEHVLRCIYLMNFSAKCLQESPFSYPVWNMYLQTKLNGVLGDSMWSFVLNILLEVTEAQAVYLWSFIDAFVMAHCIYLLAYFKAFNEIVESAKMNKSTDWGRMRAQHSLLVTLVKKIDEHLVCFVQLSFTSNLFWTIYQIFNSLVASGNVENEYYTICDPEGLKEAQNSRAHDIYYKFSSVFRITRTLAVSILSANVNTYANIPLSALGEIHASKYNTEIQRFYRQMTYTIIGVSGTFFTVTRQMILKILGTLLTYELVLLQISQNATEKVSSDNNSTLLLTTEIKLKTTP